jgi:hypothetical protein
LTEHVVFASVSAARMKVNRAGLQVTALRGKSPRTSTPENVLHIVRK